MDNFDFTGANQAPETPVDGKAERDAKRTAARRAAQQAWSASFMESVKTTNLMEIKSTKSKDIEVTHALTFGDGGAIQKDGDGEQVINVVGYTVKNIGAEPVKIVSTKCEMVEGVYVKNPIEIVLNPGQETPLRKYDFVTFLIQPEYSLTCANGKVNSRSITALPTDVEGFLEKHHFVPDGTTVAAIAESISTKSPAGQDIVTDEYASVFAYLMNAKPVKQRASKGAANKPNTNELYANYLYNLINGGR